MIVWVDDWQMQCCGEMFAVGGEVTWTLRAPDPDWLPRMFGPGASPAVIAAEEHHDDETVAGPVTTGRVAAIDEVHCRFAPLPGGPSNSLHVVPGTGILTPAHEADPWVGDRDGRRFVGFVVHLTDVRTGPQN
jgi:hypothetical protein